MMKEMKEKREKAKADKLWVDLESAHICHAVVPEDRRLALGAEGVGA